MCTLLIFQRMHAQYPVIVAANRDEYYERPSTSPQVLSFDPRIIGGRDEVQGGTWMGVNAHGLLVGLTNQRAYLKAAPRPRSRGAVVLEALRAASTDEIRENLSWLEPSLYGPFNLLFGDASQLFVAYSRPEEAHVEIEAVPPGLHVLPNDRLNSPRFQKVQRARLLAQEAAISDQPWPQIVSKLQTILADVFFPPLESIPEPPKESPLPRVLLQRLEALCIQTPTYGTCSASLVALQPGRVAHYDFAPRAPNVASFVDVMGLLSVS